jgi:hypothetical protein
MYGQNPATSRRRLSNCPTGFGADARSPTSTPRSDPVGLGSILMRY